MSQSTNGETTGGIPAQTLERLEGDECKHGTTI